MEIKVYFIYDHHYIIKIIIFIIIMGEYNKIIQRISVRIFLFF